MASPAVKTAQTADLKSAADSAAIDARRQALLELAIKSQVLVEAGMSLGLIDGDPTIRIPTVLFFEEESAQLSQEGSPALTVLAKVLLAREDSFFTLHAHGPQSGALPVLEAARGLSLLNALVDAGLAEDQIELAGGYTLDLKDSIGKPESEQGEALHIRMTPRRANQRHSATAKSKALSLKRDEAKN